ncbi:MAG: dTMP kinase [Cellulosilyticaceae bacterium]
MSKGLFIALEGGEATGKSTTAKVLKERLEKLGYEVVVTREPGGIPSAENIRNAIMDYEVDAKTELLLYLAARREHLVNKVIPSIEKGKIVITDRFHISTIVYQGYARRLGEDTVRRLNEFVCDVYPDLNIIIDLPVEISTKRKQEVEDINRLDLEGKAFHEMVEKGYRQVYKEKKEPCVMIDGTLPMDEMIDRIFDVVYKKIIEK